MRTIDELIAIMQRDWGTPRRPSRWGDSVPMLLVCRFAPRAQTSGSPFTSDAAKDLRSFWSIHPSASLFLDSVYGQWGVDLLSPSEALDATAELEQDRGKDRSEGDVVIARFRGDSDLLVLRCDPLSPDFGAVLVALPIDPRSQWPIIAGSFVEYLDRLVQSEGDKYWE